MNIRFNILNFLKEDSLYNHGMRILAYSARAAEYTGEGWIRGGKNIIYRSNGIKRTDWFEYKTFYSLSFDWKFKFTGDTVYFANSHPYTYTQL